MTKTTLLSRAYDLFAETYHAYRTSKTNFFNKHVDMPAVLSLLPNLKGKCVIDIGCGSGEYAAEFVRRGARVFGIDISKMLVEIAKKSVPSAEFKVASV